jgi:hypothetical protein
MSEKPEKSMRTSDRIVQDLRDMIRAEEERKHPDHDHVWSVAGINRPEGQTQEMHPRTVISLAKDPVTYVLLRCNICYWLVALALPGHWTDDQIMGTVPFGRPGHGAGKTAD